MSIEQSVAFRRQSLPSVKALNQTISKLGFDLIIDEADLAQHSGFLPARLQGEDSGFEWSCESASEFEMLEIEFGDRDCVVTFRTGSDEREGQAAMIAAAALMTLTNGLYFDDFDNIDESPDRILAEVREWLSGNV